MAFTYVLTTDIGKVRLLISDSDATAFHFTDAEIQVFLDIGGSVLAAACKALVAWASALSGDMASEKIGDYSYTKKQVDNMLKLAADYCRQDASIPAFAWSEFDLTGITDTNVDEDIE